jgi:hypothetical protein
VAAALLSDDNSTGSTDLRQGQGKILVHQEQASHEYAAHRYMASSLPLRLPPKPTKSGSLPYDKRHFSAGTELGSPPSATGGPAPAPQQHLPDHYVSTGCVDSPQEHQRRKAAREYNARRYSAKKLAMAKLKATENQLAVSKAMPGNLPAGQVASPTSELGATQNGKQAASFFTGVQSATPLLSNMLALPLPAVKGKSFQHRAVPLPSTMSGCRRVTKVIPAAFIPQ